MPVCQFLNSFQLRHIDIFGINWHQSVAAPRCDDFSPQVGERVGKELTSHRRMLINEDFTDRPEQAGKNRDSAKYTRRGPNR